MKNKGPKFLVPFSKNFMLHVMQMSDYVVETCIYFYAFLHKKCSKLPPAGYIHFSMSNGILDMNQLSTYAPNVCHSYQDENEQVILISYFSSMTILSDASR
jgi:hypothetical protein